MGVTRYVVLYARGFLLSVLWWAGGRLAFVFGAVEKLRIAASGANSVAGNRNVPTENMLL